jgi:hypothetical protein
VTDNEGSRKIAGRNPLNVPVPEGFENSGLFASRSQSATTAES